MCQAQASMYVEYLLKIKQHGEEWYKLSAATETADHAMFIFLQLDFCNIRLEIFI